MRIKTAGESSRRFDDLFGAPLAAGRFLGCAAIARGFDGADDAYARVLYSAEYAWVQFKRMLGGRDHRGKFIQMAVIDQLEKLFVRPWSRRLFSQGIQDEKWRTADFLEAPVKADLAAGAKCCS